MPPTISQRVAAAGFSSTMVAADRARALKARGVDVIDLSAGEPDFVTPTVIREAAKKALDDGDTHYVSSTGIAPLREAIAQKLGRDNRIEVNAGQVLVTPGGKAALFCAIQALVEPGVEVLIPEPAWGSFRMMVELAGGTVRSVPLAEGFTLTRDALERAVTPKTKLLIVNSPNNPTGHVLTETERAAIAHVAVKYDLAIIADEIYEHIIYPPHTHVSLASMPALCDRVLTVNGFSKAFAMTGWRVGYLAGPAALVTEAAKVHSSSATCTASFAQAGALAALHADLSIVTDMVDAWRKRRDMVCAALNALPGLRCAMPDGAFYAFVDVRGLGLTSSAATTQLLDSQHVAVVPGSAFGAAGEGFIRLSFATSDSTLERAVHAFERFTQA